MSRFDEIKQIWNYDKLLLQEARDEGWHEKAGALIKMLDDVAKLPEIKVDETTSCVNYAGLKQILESK